MDREQALEMAIAEAKLDVLALAEHVVDRELSQAEIVKRLRSIYDGLAAALK